MQLRKFVMYSWFTYIADCMAIRYDKKKFLTYMKKLLESADNNKVFKGIYRIEFAEVLSNFKKTCARK